MCLFVCLFICLFVCLFVCLFFVCLFICLFLSFFFCLGIFRFLFMFSLFLKKFWGGLGVFFGLRIDPATRVDYSEFDRTPRGGFSAAGRDDTE